MAAALPWVALAFTVGSTAYQYQQQKKARKKAKAEADARKGFELVIEGDPAALPIVYGKAKIGGVRSFHNTSSNFNYVASNADKTFNINLGSTQEGSKNEYLIFQQALCQGGISSVKDIIINETQFLNDSVLYNNAGIRIDVHFDGSSVDPLLKANAPERSSALFTNVSYANVYVKLNRDDPQFGGVPDIQFLVEGRKIRKVVNGVLQSTRVYSNNPAWVLLDYLLEFRKIAVEDIILTSFEAAATLCDTVKLTGATVGGNFYRPALEGTPQFARDIPLYETNITLDSAKPFRENVEAILETMGDGRLVWSQGKYKLNVQYPGLNNENIIVSDFITDDDLVLGKPISIKWPSAEERLNNVTVRFNNESENFKEDTVSWPNKPDSQYSRGIGGFVYPAVSGWDTSEGGRLLNAYGVWNLGSNTTELVYKIRPRVTGDHTLRYTADDTVSGKLDEYTFFNNSWNLYLNGQPTGFGVLKYALSHNNWKQVKTQTVYLEEGKTYEIRFNATNNKDKKGIAATLTDSTNVIIWTTREPSYAGFEEMNSDNTAYLAMLAEDNGIELETDVFLQGVTDYYHAKAKAEELVRTSRTAFSIKFTYIVKDKYLEPGDIIQLASDDIKIGLEGPLYIRVDSISLKPDLQCEIQGSRFDGTQLAWNVADNEYLKPISSYSEELPAPYYLEYTPDINDIHNGPGSLVWPSVDDARILNYNLYMHLPDDLDSSGNPRFKKIGSTPSSPFGLPDLIEEALIFGVKSVSNTGRMSKMTVTNTVNLTRAAPPEPSNLSATVFGDRAQSVKLSWTIPVTRTDGSEYKNHFTTEVFRSKINDVTLAQKIGDISYSTSFIDTPSEYGQLYYWVRFVSYAGVSGEFSSVSSVEVSFWEVFNDSVFKPPAPFNLQATPGFGQILLTWDRADYTQGGGHSMSLIYAKDWPEGESQPVFNHGYLVASVPFAEIYSHVVSPGSRWVYWIKELSRGSGLSDGFAGPVSATTEETVTDVLGALTSNGFDTNTEPFVFFATETTLPDGTVIQPGTYLKRGYIAALSVDDGKIKNVSADKIHTGFLSAERIESQSLDSTKIDTRGLTIRDEFGNIILGSGTGLDWSNVVGTNKPVDNATRNVFRGDWTFPEVYSKGDIVFSAGNSWTALLQHNSEIANAPPESGTGNTWWGLYGAKGEDGVTYSVEVESTNGTVFRPGQSTSTLLIAHVFRNGVEITSELSGSAFKWRRVSHEDPAPPNNDAAWNLLYASGYKQIVVTTDSVQNRTTYHCDILI